MKETAVLNNAWEALAELEPEDVCHRTPAVLDPATGVYQLTCFGAEVSISPQAREITAPGAHGLLKRLGANFPLTALWYLGAARNVGLTGRLVKPSSLKGGHHFFTGSHELPLKDIAARYGSDSEGFLRACAGLGGQSRDYGDVSMELKPYPRLPVTMILWLADEEFPARADLLFDSSADFHMAGDSPSIDMLWSVAMMSVAALL